MSADNIPDRLGLFYDLDGTTKAKIEIFDNSKLDSCQDFIIHREDHTILNLTRQRLLEDYHVVFAAYRQPHPLDPKYELKIRTLNCTPLIALETALSLGRQDVTIFRNKFIAATNYEDNYLENIKRSESGVMSYDSGEFGDLGNEWGIEANTGGNEWTGSSGASSANEWNTSADIINDTW